jgi:hypothetical protein
MAGAEKVMAAALSHGRPLVEFRRGTTVRGGGRMGLLRGYKYTLTENPGEGFDPRFKPALTPAEMLFMGVFEGKYLNDCTDEFPQEWFLMAGGAGRLTPEKRDVGVNYFGVDSRQPLSAWRKNGWVPVGRGKHGGKDSKGRDILADREANPDERGWFQWYCRYWLGRRIPELDDVQIGRWRSFIRHVGAIKHGCSRGALSCRPRERQALLQWAYNPFI